MQASSAIHFTLKKDLDCLLVLQTSHSMPIHTESGQGITTPISGVLISKVNLTKRLYRWIFMAKQARTALSTMRYFAFYNQLRPDLNPGRTLALALSYRDLYGAVS